MLEIQKKLKLSIWFQYKKLATLLVIETNLVGKTTVYNNLAPFCISASGIANTTDPSSR